MNRSPAACVKRYLEVLSVQPRRGTRPDDLAPLQRQLDVVEDHYTKTTDPLARVHLYQQALDLQAKLTAMETERGDFEQIEQEFIETVAAWAARKGVTYSALREAGVSARVLRRAGMSP